jgi:hypothetical protein
MPDTPVTPNNGASPITGDLPAMPETSPQKGRKTRRPAWPTADTGNGAGAATGTAATGGRRAGPRTKKPRTPITAATRLPRPDSAGHRRTRDAHDGAHDDVADRVWGALRANPAATPAELATAARLPRATVTALLTTWLTEGSVTCAAGATSRAARRWSALTVVPAPTAAPGEPTDPRDDNPATSDHATPDHAADPLVPVADENGAAPLPADTAPHPGRSGAGPGAGFVAEAPIGSEPRPVRRAAPTRNPSGSQRLPGGALRGMVEDHLRDHPGDDWGPVAIGKVLHRSSGAVANALEILDAQGIAQRTCERPKRYRLADQPEPHPATPDQTDDATATVSSVATSSTAATPVAPSLVATSSTASAAAPTAAVAPAAGDSPASG